MICAALLVLLAGALAWLLLANYGDGSAANNARLDGIRTVGTIVLGAGGELGADEVGPSRTPTPS